MHVDDASSLWVIYIGLYSPCTKVKHKIASFVELIDTQRVFKNARND